jgi:hypothetical protein
MHHELFGDLGYNQSDQTWTGSAMLRSFATFGEQYSDETERNERREGRLPLILFDPVGTGPNPPQASAFRWLRDQEADVFRAVLGALFESYRTYTASPLSGFWKWLGRCLGVKPIESPEGLDAAAYFLELQVAREYKGDAAYLLFSVNCSWEPEHGMLVVYHKDRPATWTTPDALELESDADD